MNNNRTISAPNTWIASALKRLGIGEKHDGQWYCSPDELQVAQNDHDRMVASRRARAAERQAPRQAAAEARKAVKMQRAIEQAERRRKEEEKRVEWTASTKNGPKDAEGRYQYRNEFIGDKPLFKAVCFAAKMIARGDVPGRAHRIAATYYNVDRADLARLVAQRAGRASVNRRKTV